MQANIVHRGWYWMTAIQRVLWDRLSFMWPLLNYRVIRDSLKLMSLGICLRIFLADWTALLKNTIGADQYDSKGQNDNCSNQDSLTISFWSVPTPAHFSWHFLQVLILTLVSDEANWHEVVCHSICLPLVLFNHTINSDYLFTVREVQDLSLVRIIGFMIGVSLTKHYNFTVGFFHFDVSNYSIVLNKNLNDPLTHF